MTEIGVKRGEVRLCDHDESWKVIAAKAIEKLKKILVSTAIDIQHVGSTSIYDIKAKPIIDIAIAVNSFEDVLKHEERLKAEGFYYRPLASDDTQLLFACGNYYDGTADLQTHFIHVVYAGSKEWQNYIMFREYLNHYGDTAKEYEALKLSLAHMNREEYTKGKHDFIQRVLRNAIIDRMLGQTVDIIIDRPMGSKHPRYDMIYPVNYGYINGVYSLDGKELDVYLLGVEKPIKEYKAQIIGIVRRYNDIEDKLIAAPTGMIFHQAELEEMVHFKEQYFDYEIESLYQRSCGAIVYRENGDILILRQRDGSYSVPKGHMEMGETEKQTAKREAYEETGLTLDITSDFRCEIEYTLDDYRGLIYKTLVLFCAEMTEEPSIDGKEIHEYRWVSVDEAKKLLNPSYQRALDSFTNNH